MRSPIQRLGTTVAALALVLGLASPALVVAAPTPATLEVSLAGIVCNPGDVPGIRATGTVKLVNAGSATLKLVQLAAFEYRTIDDPAYAPFPWNGMSVATWIDETSFRTSVLTDVRTLDTTDPATWDRGNFTKDLWAGSRSDAWWQVYAYATTSARGTASQGQKVFYVSCPTGRIVDGASLTKMVQVEMTKP